MRVMVDACTSRRSASALTVCGPWSDTTTSVRSCGSVTSSLTEASARTVMPTRARLALTTASTTASGAPSYASSIAPRLSLPSPLCGDCPSPEGSHGFVGVCTPGTVSRP